MIEFNRVLSDKKKHLDLLLLADPAEECIDRYLNDGDLFTLSEDGEVRAVAVVYPISDEECELKNLATDPKHQGRGYGRRLVQYLFDYYRPLYRRMSVGTGNSSVGNIAFYQKCGFAYSHTKKNFFVDNYPEPIYEDGVQCVDMIVLEKDLSAPV